MGLCQEPHSQSNTQFLPSQQFQLISKLLLCPIKFSYGFLFVLVDDDSPSLGTGGRFAFYYQQECNYFRRGCL